MNRKQVFWAVLFMFSFCILVFLWLLSGTMYCSEFEIKVRTTGGPADWILSEFNSTRRLSRVCEAFETLYGFAGCDSEAIDKALKDGSIVRHVHEGGFAWSTDMRFSAESYSRALACKVATAYLTSIENYVEECNQKIERKGLAWVESQIAILNKRVANGERDPSLSVAITNFMRMANTAKDVLRTNQTSVVRSVQPSERRVKSCWNLW